MYREKAEKMLQSLSSAAYQSRQVNNAFLLHSTGHKPNGGEIDASIIYSDYYYIEALLRLKKTEGRKNI
jgi:unsaturated chondroitin disaccharide hydrolase